jgi:hypothetical protein
MKCERQTERKANCRRWLLPVLAVLLAWTSLGGAQGIVYKQLPPSPSLGLVQDTNGNFVDPFAPYDSQGLRLWGNAQSPTNYNLILNGQLAYTFTSDGTGFGISATGTNQIIGGYLDNFGAQGAYPLLSGAFIGVNLGSTTYTWLGGESTIADVRASDTIGSPILWTGPFAGVASGYVGLEFYTDGQAYYGWVRIGAPASINGLGWVYDYAYQTSPNTSIFAGEVPEPSTFALLTLSGVAVGLLRRKRSKK